MRKLQGKWWGNCRVNDEETVGYMMGAHVRLPATSYTVMVWRCPSMKPTIVGFLWFVTSRYTDAPRSWQWCSKEPMVWVKHDKSYNHLLWDKTTCSTVFYKFCWALDRHQPHSQSLDLGFFPSLGPNLCGIPSTSRKCGVDKSWSSLQWEGAWQPTAVSSRKHGWYNKMM